MAPKGSRLDWEHYFQFDDIMAFIADIEEAHSQNVTVYDIGLSYELRPIRVLNINTAGATKKIWIDGGTVIARINHKN